MQAVSCHRYWHVLFCSIIHFRGFIWMDLWEAVLSFWSIAAHVCCDTSMVLWFYITNSDQINILIHIDQVLDGHTVHMLSWYLQQISEQMQLQKCEHRSLGIILLLTGWWVCFLITRHSLMPQRHHASFHWFNNDI